MTHAQDAFTRLLAAHGYQAESVRPLGAGLDHTAFDVDGELVARLSRLPDPAERAREVEREAQLLHRIAAISPLAVPTPLYTDPDGGWLAYRKLPGEPLLGLPVTAQLATTVGSGSSPCCTPSRRRPGPGSSRTTTPRRSRGCRRRVAAFYAGCSLLEDLAYGVETGRDAYVRNSLSALARVFPPRR